MTDRYLFRGKSRGRYGYWRHGSLFIDDDGTYTIMWNIKYGELRGDIEHSRVIPKTAGQCTGIKDKNHELIFEGDIVKAPSGIVGDIKYGKFYYSACDEYPCDRIGYYIDCEFNGYVDGQKLPLEGEAELYEIIGNIHDDPELLEVKT